MKLQMDWAWLSNVKNESYWSFQNVFTLDLGAFSTFKYGYHIRVKDLLDTFIYKWGFGPFCVFLLTDRYLKGLK